MPIQSQSVVIFQILLLLASICVLFPIVCIPNTTNSAGILKVEAYDDASKYILDHESLQFRKRKLPRAELCASSPANCMTNTDDKSDDELLHDLYNNDDALIAQRKNEFVSRAVPGRDDFITLGAFQFCRRNNKAKTYCSEYGTGSLNSTISRLTVIEGSDFLSAEEKTALTFLPALSVVGPLTWTCIGLQLIALFCLIQPIRARVSEFEGKDDDAKKKAKATALGLAMKYNKPGIIILSLSFLIGNLTTLFLIDDAWDLNQRVNIIFASTGSIYRSHFDVVYKLFLAAWAMTSVVLIFWIKSLHSAKVIEVEKK